MRIIKHLFKVAGFYIKRITCKHTNSSDATCPYTGKTYTTCTRCYTRLAVRNAE